MTDIVVEDMRREHVRQIIEIEAVSFTTPWNELSFYNELYLPGGISRVALSGGDVVGFICARHDFLDEAHLLDLAVCPDRRRTGIARMLVEDVVRKLKSSGCAVLHLEVRGSNEAAIKLYEGIGFKRVGSRKNYYIVPLEDAVLMSLAL